MHQNNLNERKSYDEFSFGQKKQQSIIKNINNILRLVRSTVFGFALASTCVCLPLFLRKQVFYSLFKIDKKKSVGRQFFPSMGFWCDLMSFRTWHKRSKKTYWTTMILASEYKFKVNWSFKKSSIQNHLIKSLLMILAKFLFVLLKNWSFVQSVFTISKFTRNI